MKTRIVLISIIITLMFSFTGCTQNSKEGIIQSEGVKYTMYIGLNDQDTYTQQISTEEAQKMVANIALQYVDGFTQTTAMGAYKDEKGVVTYEKSLVFSFSYASEEQMQNIMNDVLEELNQNSILIEKENVNYDFYEGEMQ